MFAVSISTGKWSSYFRVSRRGGAVVKMRVWGGSAQKTGELDSPSMQK
jgi:hypothetical protein